MSFVTSVVCKGKPYVYDTNHHRGIDGALRAGLARPTRSRTASRAPQEPEAFFTNSNTGICEVIMKGFLPDQTRVSQVHLRTARLDELV